MGAALATSAQVLRAAADRVKQLLVSDFDRGAVVRRSVWTIRDVAAHLAIGAEVYRDLSFGKPSPYVDPADRAATSQKLIDADPEHNLSALADRIHAATTALLDNVGSVEDDTALPWHARLHLPAPHFLGVLTGEFLIHGFDIAHTLRHPWPIGTREALVVAEAMTVGAPHGIDKKAARGRNGAVELRLRGNGTHLYHFADGVLTTSLTPSPGRPDLRISADPVAWILVGYGRRSPIVAALTGRIRLASRPNPRLARRLMKVMSPP